jgi:uncharacterized membrane protein YdjX (TVP38/TMEM64 family)
VRFRRLLTWAWVALVLAVLVVWLRDPGIISAERFGRLLRSLGPWAFPGFVVIALVRGPLLVPSTPVVLAGGALFPEALLGVLTISMVGIVLSAALLYRFPGFAGYDTVLAARYPKQLARLQVHLEKPEAMWIVAAWAFLPVVPTDLICYAAGLVRMPFRRMIAGIIIGELPLVTMYILLGTRLAGLLPS